MMDGVDGRGCLGSGSCTVGTWDGMNGIPLYEGISCLGVLERYED